MLHYLNSSFWKVTTISFSEINYLKIKWHLTYKYKNHIILQRQFGYQSISQKLKWIGISILKPKKIMNTFRNDQFSQLRRKSIHSLLFLFFFSTCLVYIPLSSFNWPIRLPLFLTIFTDHPKITNEIAKCLQKLNRQKTNKQTNSFT